MTTADALAKKIESFFKVAAETARASGQLRVTANSKWNTATPPPPKSTPVNKKAKSRPVAKPPSKSEYYKDISKSLNDTQRGFRSAVVG